MQLTQWHRAGLARLQPDDLGLDGAAIASLDRKALTQGKQGIQAGDIDAQPGGASHATIGVDDACTQELCSGESQS